MQYCRIDLSKTNYSLDDTCKLIINPDIDQLKAIYHTYCSYKNFASVVPLFEYQFTNVDSFIFGYYDNEKLVAFTLLRKLDKHNVENCQFAWDYNNPKLRIGIRSLKNECAIFKKWGYHYMYLGFHSEYKSQLDGYEIMGKL